MFLAISEKSSSFQFFILETWRAKHQKQKPGLGITRRIQLASTKI